MQPPVTARRDNRALFQTVGVVVCGAAVCIAATAGFCFGRGTATTVVVETTTAGRSSPAPSPTPPAATPVPTPVMLGGQSGAAGGSRLSSPAPSPTLRPATPMPAVAAPFSVPPQEVRQVPAGMTCSGDIIINNERWFDGDGGTALVVYFRQAAQVMGPWGYSCKPGDDRTAECGRKREFEGFRACQPTDVFPR